MRKRQLPAWIRDNFETGAAELVESTLFKFKVRLQVPETRDDGKIQFKEIVVDLLPDTVLDYENLDQQLTEIPSMYAFWASVYSEVKMGVAIAERKVKMRYAKVYELIQQEYIENGIRPTAEVMKRVVEKDAELARLEIEYQKAQMQAGKLYHMVEMIRMKSELARSMCGIRRAEMGLS